MTAPNQIAVPVGNLLPFALAKILISTTTSNTIPTGGNTLVGIQMPAAFTGAHITFLAGEADDATFQPMYNAAGQVKYSVTQGQYICIDPKDFYGVAFLKIVSDATEVAERDFTIALKGI